MTNFEKIKTMSVEEMAEFLDRKTGCGVCRLRKDQTCSGKCVCGIEQWLESEAKK